MEAPSIRDPARRAEAERYIRSSGAKLRFWLSCWIVAPVVNVLAMVGAVALAEWAEGPPDALAGLPVAGVLAIEAVVLRRLCRIFAPRREIGYLVGGLAVVVVMSMLLWGGVGFVWLATHAQD